MSSNGTPEHLGVAGFIPPVKGPVPTPVLPALPEPGNSRSPLPSALPLPFPNGLFLLTAGCHFGQWLQFAELGPIPLPTSPYLARSSSLSFPHFLLELVFSIRNLPSIYFQRIDIPVLLIGIPQKLVGITITMAEYDASTGIGAQFDTDNGDLVDSQVYPKGGAHGQAPQRVDPAAGSNHHGVQEEVSSRGTFGQSSKWPFSTEYVWTR